MYSDKDYEPEDDDDNILGAKELLGGTSIHYALTEANILFSARLGQTAYDSILEQISICDAVHNRWSLLCHVIYGYDEANEKTMSGNDIHRTKMILYYIVKELCHCLNSNPPTVYNATDKLEQQGCCITTVKYTKENEKYEANNSDTAMGWYQKLRE